MLKIDRTTIDYLEKYPHKKHFDEDFTKYQFVDGELCVTPLNKLNTLEHLQEIQQKLLNNPNGGGVFERGLEDSWKLLCDEYNSKGKKQLDEREDYLAPFSSFRYWVGLGIYPPPETLLALLECFETYISLEGKVELEQIFFGKKKIGTGNHSARMAREKIMRHFHTRWQTEKNKIDSPKTQSELAEEFIERFNLADSTEDDYVDSFLRQYRRFIQKQK